MSSGDRTQIGGSNGGFQTTHWTQIISARLDDTARQQEAVGAILGQYWKPVYCYLRRKGSDNEKAKDLTQAFFCEIVLGRDLIPQADKEKGRFRTLLLTALDRYVADVYRREHALKRRPEVLVSLDGAVDRERLPEPAGRGSPEQAFHHAWASALLDEVLAEVEQGLRDGGQTLYWQVFEARVLQPILKGTEPTPLKKLCSQYGIKDAKKASNMVITAKRRFATVMRRKVGEWADREDDIEQEIRELMEILSHPGAA